mmetsp:Transcript_60954/g.193346  ORF Transcript_60954/g.193346 Transcript_60954/m.193346 type:complete len:224 (-) Transcript_60954:422-1093(-)
MALHRSRLGYSWHKVPACQPGLIDVHDGSVVEPLELLPHRPGFEPPPLPHCIASNLLLHVREGALLVVLDGDLPPQHFQLLQPLLSRVGVLVPSRHPLHELGGELGRSDLPLPVARVEYDVIVAPVVVAQDVGLAGSPRAPVVVLILAVDIQPALLLPKKERLWSLGVHNLSERLLLHIDGRFACHRQGVGAYAPARRLGRGRLLTNGLAQRGLYPLAAAESR